MRGLGVEAEIWVKIPNILCPVNLQGTLQLDQGFTSSTTCGVQGPRRQTPALGLVRPWALFPGFL